jgi:hypothetical protein
MLDIHHIAYTARPALFLHRDLVKAYNGEKLAEETFTMGDFALLEAERMRGEEYKQDEAYFSERLAGSATAKLPILNRSEQAAGTLDKVSEFIDYQQVSDYCRQAHISPNNLFAGALGICLNRYSRESKLCFCTAHHGRIDDRLRDSIGMFVRLCPWWSVIDPGQKLQDLLQDPFRHERAVVAPNYPFASLVTNYGVAMDLTYTYQKGILEYFDMPHGMATMEYLHEGSTYDKLSIYIYQFPDTFEIRCEYNNALYDRDYVETFAAAFKNTLMQIVAADPATTTCSGIAITNPAEKQKY